jgi:hypothetical protein
MCKGDWLYVLYVLYIVLWGDSLLRCLWEGCRGYKGLRADQRNCIAWQVK